jgi:hypothetical protein
MMRVMSIREIKARLTKLLSTPALPHDWEHDSGRFSRIPPHVRRARRAPSVSPISPEPRMPICLLLLHHVGVYRVALGSPRLCNLSHSSACGGGIITCGIGRHRPSPSTRRLYRQVFPEWRCASWPWLVWRRASASRRAGTRPHHPAVSFRLVRLRAGLSHSLP